MFQQLYFIFLILTPCCVSINISCFHTRSEVWTFPWNIPSGLQMRTQISANDAPSRHYPELFLPATWWDYWKMSEWAHVWNTVGKAQEDSQRASGLVDVSRLLYPDTTACFRNLVLGTHLPRTNSCCIRHMQKVKSGKWTDAIFRTISRVHVWKRL